MSLHVPPAPFKRKKRGKHRHCCAPVHHIDLISAHLLSLHARARMCVCVRVRGCVSTYVVPFPVLVVQTAPTAVLAVQFQFLA